jgi:4-hydroxy-tetrahydrodipicolinate reductase
VLAPAIATAEDMRLQSAVARRELGRDAGEAAGGPHLGVLLEGDIEAALDRRPDVLVDYTHPLAVRRHVELAVSRGIPVVIGTSGLTGQDFAELDAAARRAGVGVATGNFSLTAALLQHLARIAARHVPSIEIIEQGSHRKPDAPSGTARELAELLARERCDPPAERPAQRIGPAEALGADIAGVPVHSIRLPGTSPVIEVILAAPGERLVLRHDEQEDATIFVAGTLLAARRVQHLTGLVRGLDELMFGPAAHD